jgi:putative transposase
MMLLVEGQRRTLLRTYRYRLYPTTQQRLALDGQLRSVIALDARNTSQQCSACGALVPKPLGERRHRCACGYQADRDVNAARNLLRLGESRQASTWPTGACVA